MTPTLDILKPVFVLAMWTSWVLLLIPITRIRAARRREVVADDFKYGESAAVPDRVGLPNRNYMNLLELPVLFYVICLIAYVSQTASPTALVLAWLYVVLRLVHTGVHLSYNHVMHRFAVFAASNGVLIALWLVVGMGIWGAAQ